jgi:hypothetical protein
MQQCQRHGWVPDPRNPVGQLVMRATRSGDQNPFRCDSRFRNSLCGPTIHDTTRPSSRNERRSCYSICAASGSHAGAHTNNSRYHYFEQQNGGQPGGNSMPRTTHSRRCRRQVLHPTHSIGLLAIRGTWSGEQNLTTWYTVSIKNSCDSRLLSVGAVIAVGYISVSHTRSTTTGLPPSRQQRNGGDGGLLVGSGVQPTVWSCHPRRRVPAPGQSMNRGDSRESGAETRTQPNGMQLLSK